METYLGACAFSHNETIFVSIIISENDCGANAVAVVLVVVTLVSSLHAVLCVKPFLSYSKSERKYGRASWV